MTELSLPKEPSLRKKYRTVVIDPPWNVQCNLNKMNYGIGKPFPYRTMADQEILAFPINDFAEDDSDLFMWVTHTKLPVAIQIIEKWGFKFHVLLIWDKLGGVCISGFYRNTELVVYSYRGRLGVDTTEGKYIPTLFKEKATGHSKKPDVFYDWVRKRTLEPRIDLFARQKHFGFDAWGDEVDERQTTLLIREVFSPNV
jgi:N6-adenosine-specific RNA methylase IME4